jgi:hypothetical protein
MASNLAFAGGKATPFVVEIAWRRGDRMAPVGARIEHLERTQSVGV